MSSVKTNNFLSSIGQTAAERVAIQDHYNESAESMLADLFPEQQAVITDPCRRKSLLTPRRAGKTHTAITYALIVACLYPKCRVPIITLTLKSAKRLYWEPMQQFSEKYGLGIKFSFSEQTATLKNGSVIFLGGAESKSDIEKFRGGAYKLVVIDECKSFNLGIFEELVFEILYPATNDVRGTILVIGTPGALLDGPFYEATCPGLTDDQGLLVTRDFYRPEPFWDTPDKDGEPRLPLWQRHYWTSQANIFAPHVWQEALDDKRRKRWEDDNPIWVRESLGQWVASEETQVYALHGIIRNAGGVHKAKCCWRRGIGKGFNKHGLAEEHDWRYVMGVDFGYEDDFAIVVVAYSRTHDTFYHVYDYKAPHLNISAQGEIIKRTLELFEHEIEAMVADSGGLGKLAMESLNEIYGFYLEAAEKNEKFDYIELLNSDLHAGQLKILPGTGLFDEMNELQLDLGGRSKRLAARMNKLRENRAQDNHLCDALLYTWRFCLHHFSRQLIKPPEEGSPEYYEDWDYDEACEAAARRDAPVDETAEWTDSLTDDERLSTWEDSLFPTLKRF